MKYKREKMYKEDRQENGGHEEKAEVKNTF